MTEHKRNYDKIAAQAKLRWDRIAKPIDSLGLLEDYVVKLCAIAGQINPDIMKKRALVSLCADHGVVREGVTQTGSEVTRIVAENFAKGCSSVNYMSAVSNVDVFAVDIGMDTEEYKENALVTGQVINRKIARGTGNLARESAMTVLQCRQAIELGINIVGELKAMGYDIIATGEMGIGNTTPTSVLAAMLLGLTADEVTGRGAGLSDKAFLVKKNVVTMAMKRIAHEFPDKEIYGEEAIQKLIAEVGGYEIAGMVGLYLGGVKYRIPIIIDGAISAISALCAWRIDETVADYALASHVSEEITGGLALREMKLPAIIRGRMCLGEGTGAVALFPLLDMGLNVYKSMGTFEELDIEAYDRSGKPMKDEADEMSDMPYKKLLPGEIEAKSFEIISSELGDIKLDPMQAPIIKRCIHTSADFDYLYNLCFSDDVVRKLQAAIRDGACIVTDTQMGKSGINKTELAKYGGEVFCFMSDEDVAAKAKEQGKTRAVVSMEKAAELERPLIFAIGNAPTALIRLHELIDEGRIKPCGIIGVPVGFVNVVEAKELIIKTDVPYIVARGRKGGSNIAAAVCNALLYGMK